MGQAGITDGCLYNWVPWLLRGNKALIGVRSWTSPRLEVGAKGSRRIASTGWTGGRHIVNPAVQGEHLPRRVPSRAKGNA